MSKVDREVLEAISELQAFVKHLPLAFTAGFGGFFILTDRIVENLSALGRIGAFSVAAAFLFMGAGLICSVVAFLSCTVAKMAHLSESDDKKFIEFCLLSALTSMLFSLVCVVVVVIFSFAIVYNIVY